MVVIIAIISAGFGSVYIPPLVLAKIIVNKLEVFKLIVSWPDSWNIIVWEIRLPRVIVSSLVGAGLAISGATYQGLFRNPLASPYLIGVASGAGLGATVVLLSGVPTYLYGFSILPLAAFVGGMVAVTASYLISKKSDGSVLPVLILAGVAIGFFASALTSILMIRSDPDLRPLLSWLLGSFAGTRWIDVYVVIPYMVLGFIVMMIYGRILNLMQVDEEEAKQLGVNVERAKLALISIASLVTAAAVSVSGPIGFVGLIAPHTVRIIFGHDYRFLLPMSAIVGSGFMILADLISRVIVSPGELPVGVVTALCGAPFFLMLLKQKRAVFT